MKIVGRLFGVLLLFECISAYADTYNYRGSVNGGPQTAYVRSFADRSEFEGSLNSFFTEDFSAVNLCNEPTVTTGHISQECSPFGRTALSGNLVDSGGTNGNVFVPDTSSLHISGWNAEFNAFGVDVLGIAPWETVYFSFMSFDMPGYITYSATNTSGGSMFFGLYVNNSNPNNQGPMIFEGISIHAETYGGQPASFSLDNMTLGKAALTPEPGTLLLLGTGSLALLGALRRKLSSKP